MDTNIVFDFKMIDNSEADIHNETCTKVDHIMNNCSEADMHNVTCTKVDHIMNNCSHNVTPRHSNDKDNN
jgi:predicted ATPase